MVSGEKNLCYDGGPWHPTGTTLQVNSIVVDYPIDLYGSGNVEHNQEERERFEALF